MAYIQIEVDLEEFDLSEILSELEYRYEKNGVRGKSNKLVIDDFIKKMGVNPNGEIITLQTLSLIDKMKVDFVLNNLDKIKLNDLEKLI